MTTERRFCNIYLCRSLKHIESLKSEYNTKDEQWIWISSSSQPTEETEKVSAHPRTSAAQREITKIMFCCFQILFNSGPSSNVGPGILFYSEDCFWRALVRVILAPSLTGSPVIVIIIFIINILIFISILIIVIIIGPNWVACDCDTLPTTYCSRTTLKGKI